MLNDSNLSKQEELIKSISALVSDIEKAASIEYLNGLVESLSDEGFDEHGEFLARVATKFFLQTITRENNKRRRAADMLIDLISQSSPKKGLHFEKYLEALEKELNQSNRSFFKKLTIGKANETGTSR